MWEIIAKQLGTVNNFPVGKHARKDIRNGKGRGNQTLVIHIDVFCVRSEILVSFWGSMTRLSSRGPQTYSHPVSII